MAAPWQKMHEYYFVLIEVVEKGKKIKKAACKLCNGVNLAYIGGTTINYITTWNRNTRRVLLKVVERNLGSNN